MSFYTARVKVSHSVMTAQCPDYPRKRRVADIGGCLKCAQEPTFAVQQICASTLLARADEVIE
jgi:hypothetical protein